LTDTPTVGRGLDRVDAVGAVVMTVPFASGLATRTTSCTEPEPPAASEPIDQ